MAKKENLNPEERKQKEIKKEYNKIKKILKNLDEDKLKVVDSLISNAAFMSVSLKDLQTEINVKGYISKYQNGENQWGTKKSPEIEIYNSMVKNYSSITKQLTDLLPKESSKGDDGFQEFMMLKK